MQKVLSSLLDVDRLAVAMPLEVAAETGLFSVFGEGFADRRPTPAPARAVTTATRPRRPAAI
jgi:hypothetical protein